MKTLSLSVVLSTAAFAGAPFTVTSTDIHEGKPLAEAQVANTFGCTGGNVAPELSWKNAPAGTKSFAVTVYDPDAPSGSGWWHWVLYDLPASTTSLPQGSGTKAPLPEGAKVGRNDAGPRDFLGACPPVGDKPHHYIVTVFALKVEALEVPPDATSALIGFMLNANSLGKAKVTGTYKRAH
jgi:Raf kinase inhibitor-like YbhB/YbcL family protein